ncbi:MAG TPA: lipoyl(octanoyl) transferase LipB [Thermoplasmata archaeon]|nr:lipoyl(octanoyl) transferase LipB [Thermoplasmata archaeon]
MVLETREWGVRPYLAALAEMRALRALRQRGEIPDTLILVEHPPVVTVGVQGSDGEVLPEGIPVVPVERGGKGTYHGPGQLVGYPIVDLNARGRDVRRFVADVERVVIDALGEVGIVADRVAGRRGVWVDGARKIASIGVAVEAWVTFHGFALNVSNDLAPFRAFHPCGLPGTVMTSVEAELGRPVPPELLHGPVVASWERVFGAPIPIVGPGPAIGISAAGR